MELTKLYSSRGIDGLSRSDRERMNNYNRRDFLFEKFLNTRRTSQSLQLTHEHILEIGDKSLRKFELKIRKDSRLENELILRNEISRLEAEVEEFKNEIKKEFYKQFENEKESMKQSYDLLMRRIEKQRDAAEEERMKELIKRMNDECEIALKKQWEDAEELRKKTLDEIRELTRKELLEQMRLEKEKAVKLALEKAEEEFKIREAKAIERTRAQCEMEANEKIRIICERYDASIESLLQKIKETEEKLSREIELRKKFENDFRLLQADYKRFMNYTEHYNSDYMMKLRHIGTNLLEDKEFEYKLDDRLNSLNLNSNKNKNLNEKKKKNLSKKFDFLDKI